jgi:hypothetical protein
VSLFTRARGGLPVRSDASQAVGVAPGALLFLVMFVFPLSVVEAVHGRAAASTTWVSGRLCLDAPLRDMVCADVAHER